MNALTQKDYHTGNIDKYQSGRPFVTKRLDYFFDCLAKLIALIEPPYVLSIGCGEGLDLKNIFERSNAGFLYTCGLDLKLDALQMANKILASFRFDVIQGDLHHLPVKLDKFNMILCLEVLEHLQYPGLILNELSQHFKGYCLFSVPNEPFYRLTRMLLFRRNIRQLGNHPEHLNQWSRAGFIHYLKEFFIIDQVVTPYPWTAVLCHTRVSFRCDAGVSTGLLN